MGLVSPMDMNALALTDLTPNGTAVAVWLFKSVTDTSMEAAQLKALPDPNRIAEILGPSAFGTNGKGGVYLHSGKMDDYLRQIA